MLKLRLAASILLLIWVNHVFAELNVENLDDILQLNVEQNYNVPLQKQLSNGHFITHGLNLTFNQLTIHGSSQTKIVMDKEHHTLFFGHSAHISLHKLLFPVIDEIIIANIERLSQMIFKDNTLISKTIIQNCFQVDGGELILDNLKLEFHDNQRKIMNLIQFSDIGGHLRVLKTNIERMNVIGGKPLFGDKHATDISLSKCKFSNILVDNKGIFVDNFVGQTNVTINSCSFIDVEDALIGGVVQGLNQNGNLLVVGSSFKSCHNTKQINKDISNQKYHTEIISGDAKFEDDIFKECISLSYGGAISFISNGKLVLDDCKFMSCSAQTKGGAVYVLGSGEHNFKGLKFEDCAVSDLYSAEGGSIYLESGTSYIKDSTILNSKAEIKTQSETESSQSSSSKGGAIFIHDWQTYSYIKEVKIDNSEAGFGGAVYISSSADVGRMKITDVKFRNNVANIGGGGAVYAKDATLIYIGDAHFASNEAAGPYQGKDVHFGDLGISSDNLKLEKLQRDVISDSRSNTSEPRICIENYLCPSWIEDELNLPVWAIITISLVVTSLVVTAIIIIIACLLRRRSKVKVNDNKLQGETNNQQYTVGVSSQYMQGPQQIQAYPNIYPNQTIAISPQNAGQINQNIQQSYRFSAPPSTPIPSSLPPQNQNLIYNPPPPNVQDLQEQDKDNLLE